jgi:hypothetical protein
MANGILTTKQEAFIAAYLGVAHGNATEAARMAGYKTPMQEGSRLLRNAVIAARVSQHVAEVIATADDVLRELADVAFADWREFVTVRTHPKTGAQIDVRMDLTNKVKALELLGKYHSLFVEKQEVNVNIREHRVVGIPQAELDVLFAPAQARELNA